MPVFGQVLGIEGTAWNLSAAVFESDLISLVSRPYRPPHGGIHPREAAQHHASAIGEVIGSVLKQPEKITGIAFSQGPGLGPCLRTVATAARSLALALNVPLVGVNHCIAHVEIGKFATGCSDPIVLYASGANTQVIGYLNGRYRIFGETLDIGIGNALDKFARSKDLPHPGGPLVEKLAKAGSYFSLPYTVKGMDLAFSGLMSAAKESRAPLEDTCHSFQETAFAMCVEVTERALSLAGKDEVLLVGGVGANNRLQEMLKTMCGEREARFFVPEQKYLGDNAAMIAYTGKLMLETGQSLPVESSQINPSFRSDEVVVTWKEPTRERPQSTPVSTRDPQIARGAEAVIEFTENRAIKHRLPKRYRVSALDIRLITERTRAEARLIAASRRAGVPTPVICDITEDAIIMELVDGMLLKFNLTGRNLEAAGKVVGTLHRAGIMHGDLTTSNIILQDGRCVLIDFGLSQVTSEIEQQGVDVHVLFQTLTSTTADAEDLKAAFIRGYRETFEAADAVIAREHEIELRGRYL